MKKVTCISAKIAVGALAIVASTGVLAKGLLGSSNIADENIYVTNAVVAKHFIRPALSQIEFLATLYNGTTQCNTQPILIKKSSAPQTINVQNVVMGSGNLNCLQQVTSIQFQPVPPESNASFWASSTLTSDLNFGALNSMSITLEPNDEPAFNPDGTIAHTGTIKFQTYAYAK